MLLKSSSCYHRAVRPYMLITCEAAAHIWLGYKGKIRYYTTVIPHYNMNILLITSIVSCCMFCYRDSFKVVKLCFCLSSSLLPPQFPQEKPVVSVYPPVGHHLVDSNNGTMITSPLISNVSSCSVHYLIRPMVPE